MVKICCLGDVHFTVYLRLYIITGYLVTDIYPLGVWFGLNNIDGAGDWRWSSTGLSTIYHEWDIATNQLTNTSGIENYACLWFPVVLWHDCFNYMLLRFMCEIQTESWRELCRQEATRKKLTWYLHVFWHWEKSLYLVKLRLYSCDILKN